MPYYMLCYSARIYLRLVIWSNDHSLLCSTSIHPSIYPFVCWLCVVCWALRKTFTLRSRCLYSVSPQTATQERRHTKFARHARKDYVFAGISLVNLLTLACETIDAAENIRTYCIASDFRLVLFESIELRRAIIHTEMMCFVHRITQYNQVYSSRCCFTCKVIGLLAHVSRKLIALLSFKQ